MNNTGNSSKQHTPTEDTPMTATTMSAQAEMNLEVVTFAGGLEITRGQLSEAFDSIANPEDWRAPINATVPNKDANLVLKAIRFFTGCDVVISCPDDEHTQFIAAGYRNGPCGP